MYVLQQRKQYPEQIHIIISTKGNKSSGKFKVERSDTHYTFQQPHQENEEEQQEQEELSLDEIYSQIKGADVSRSKSDTKPASVEVPTKLLARKMKNSASVSLHFYTFKRMILKLLRLTSLSH